MEQLTATLVREKGNQRFYKLNHKLTVGFSPVGEKIDLIEKLKYSKEKEFKPEYKYLCPTDGFDVICVSDATTHFERLVFGAITWSDGEVDRTRIQIDGCHTFMIHGGDISKMKPDYVYLRRLAKINGLQFNLANFSAN